jgi:hypothetical protein
VSEILNAHSSQNPIFGIRNRYVIQIRLRINRYAERLIEGCALCLNEHRFKQLLDEAHAKFKAASGGSEKD